MPAYRDHRDGRWRYRKWVTLPDGARVRIKGTPSLDSKAAAEASERAHIQRQLNPPAESPPEKEVMPTFNLFADEFERTYVKANNKPSGVEGKRSVLHKHLRPAFGKLRLDEVGVREVEALKAKLLADSKAPHTVNNVLAVFGKLVNYAVEIGVLEKAPRVKLVKVPPQKFDFLTFDEYERLLKTARPEPEWLLPVLVGADAGLRRGEILALQWGDVDLVAHALTVRRGEWKGKLVAPKGGRERTIPLTARLEAALKAVRHLRGQFVLADADGHMLTREVMRWNLPRLCRKAGLRPLGWHSLRHTFCSHLAMRGVPAKAIQELAGHASLSTTLRYMHLQPGSLRTAIDALESGAFWATGGPQVRGGGAAGGDS